MTPIESRLSRRDPFDLFVYLEVVASFADRGAQGVILGCAEIRLLSQSSDTDVLHYDTTELHAGQAVQSAIGQI